MNYEENASRRDQSPSTAALVDVPNPSPRTSIDDDDAIKVRKLPKELLFVFFLLYVSEGVVVHTSSKLMPALYNLPKLVGSTGAFYFFSISMLAPYILKLVFAVISDRYRIKSWGHRKPLVVIGLSMCIVGEIVVISIPIILPGMLFPYGVVIALSLLYLLGISVMDAAADGWGIDVTSTEGQESRVQAFFVGGRAVGVAAAVLFLSPDPAWTKIVPAWVFLGIVAFIMILSIVLVMFTKEEVKPAVTTARLMWTVTSSICDLGFIVVTVSGAIAAISLAAIDTIFTEFVKTDYLFSSTTSNYMVAIQAAGTLVGATLGQYLVEKLTYARAYPLSVMFLLLGSLLPSLIYDALLAWIFPLFMGIGIGLFSACFFALSMGMCKKQAAATMFALIMLGGAVGTAAGSWGAEFFKQIWGYRTFFMIVALIGLVQIPVVYYLFFRKKGSVSKQMDETRQDIEGVTEKDSENESEGEEISVIREVGSN